VEAGCFLEKVGRGSKIEKKLALNKRTRGPDLPYCVNCTKFVFSGESLKLLPPCRRPILKLKCTKFDFGWGSAPDPAGGAYSAPQLDLRWLYFEGNGGKTGRVGKGGEEERGWDLLQRRRGRGKVASRR